MRTQSTMLFLLLMSIGCFNANGQSIPTYPIPSYNVLVNGYANFRQDYHPAKTNKSKIVLNVRIRSALNQNCQSTVWVYSLDQTTLLGPYTVLCGETISVPIDDRQWGVLVESDIDVLVDVWTSISDQMKLLNYLENQNHIDLCLTYNSPKYKMISSYLFNF